uniref:ATP-dependent DNA helicase PIF1 n=1 Tax=Cacopsylla melanoneura TaxID=428564 RepID=A0A8D9BLJ6_9HEMI
MLQKNLDIKAGLVNGSRGVFEAFQYNFEGKLESIKIKLSNKTVNMERIQAKFEVFPGAFIIRNQFPICVSYAITIHKCQGISVPFRVLDVGQSIFAHGQTYVALSRVTSLAGLHIINFDPSKCKASKEAIEEYNRLREAFCPHLPAISHCELRLPHQSDRVWKQQKHIQDEQAETIPPLELICIPGFTNADGVSCYANSVLQCLFHCEPILLKLLEDSSNDPLSLIARSFISQSDNIDCRSLRNCIGEPFSRVEQQDPSEFLAELLVQYPDLHEMFTFTIVNIKACNQCNYERRIEEQNNTLLKLPLLGGKSTLKDMILNYTDWNVIEESTCPTCQFRGTLREKFEFAHVSQYLVLTLSLWQATGKVANFKLTALPSTVLKIQNSRFVLKSAIFHHGMEIQSGHYTAMLKKESHFIRTNDKNVGKERWPNASKDVYMIILEQK